MSETTEVAPARFRFAWVSIAVAIVFGILFAYDLWEALGNLLGLSAYYSAAGLANQTPWALLIVNLAVPAIAYLIALLLGRGRSVLVKSVLFVVALCAVAVLSLDAVALLPYA
jgi:hypothetical protein